MTPEIRVEFMNAAHRAFGNLQYGIIGGAALAEFGNIRERPTTWTLWFQMKSPKLLTVNCCLSG